MTEQYLTALAITIVVEVPIVAALFRGQRARMAVVCALATTATHLIMHFAVLRIGLPRPEAVVIGEAQALALEAVAYGLLARPRDWPRALVASALANSASYGAGFAVHALARLAG